MCPECVVLDCCPPSGLDDYLLVGGIVLNNEVSVVFQCPEGYSCAPGTYPKTIVIEEGRLRWHPPPTPRPQPESYPIRLQCCDGVIIRQVSAGITQTAYDALLQEMADEWARRQAGCEEKGFRSRRKRQTNDAQTINCPNGDDLFNVSGLPLSAFLPTAFRISVDGKGLTVLAGVVAVDNTGANAFLTDAELKAQANEQALALVTARFNSAISAGQLQCGVVPAPCDLGVSDNTIIAAASAPNPQPLNDQLSYNVGIGNYEWFYLNGFYKSDDNPCPGEFKVTQETAIVNDGASVNNLLQGQPYCDPADPGVVEAAASNDLTRSLTLYHHLTQIRHRFVGQNPTNFVAGSPNPTWRIRRTKKPKIQPPARLRVRDFATVFAPTLVGCDGAANPAAEPVWDGTFPNDDFSGVFVNWAWRPDFSLGLQLNGKVLSTATRLYHSTAAEPTATGCAWVLGVDFDTGFGSWVGLGGNGYQPAGEYVFNPAASGWSLCSQKADARVATVAALPANTRLANVITANSNGALPAIDGVSLAVSDRILLKNEAAFANNGIYTVTDLGSAGTPWVLTRSTDADTSPEVTQGIFLQVTQGVVNALGYFRLVTTGAITLNTTGLTFLRMPSSVIVETY
ncbi:MAG TPA: hypothetical protein VFU31_21070 [Candidatus Binatia bacterium]|nr:hypothetical protein [Candidatus Binatia bacterium]